MKRAFLTLGIFLLTAAAIVLVGASSRVSAQPPDNDTIMPGKDRGGDNQPRNVKEYLARQRAEKAKRDHEELLKRGEELVELTDQLETAFAHNNELTPADRSKLESMEKLVTKIRKGLGGDDDDESENDPDSTEAEKKPGPVEQPNTVKQAFDDLKEMTGKLVEELKKTSRFTVSAVAIQSSNSLLKIVRFLRLKK